ncbi:hypothetical protein JCM9533A_33000 [Catenuloplanes niger JCM 9533]
MSAGWNRCDEVAGPGVGGPWCWLPATNDTVIPGSADGIGSAAPAVGGAAANAVSIPTPVAADAAAVSHRLL